MLEDERLKLILDAAYACFTRHGVRRTTMDDIAREAGMSRPGVYQYVRNKEDAFRRLASRLLDGALTEARDAVDSHESLRDRLTAVLEAKLGLALRLWRDSPAHAAELLGADTRLSVEQVQAYNTAMRDMLAEAVTAEHAGADANEVAELLLALTRGLEADLGDAAAPVRRLRNGVALFVAGLDDTNGRPAGNNHIEEPS
ncbi:TetR/AcrR family transcriptional regulator [Streptomyces sp. NPDC057428]|uniref:TetR/AcrR family transcriptional regulator n=1 Tax=Streptomyces sp. NPDC057428 TaxID=3346129 RepID=UPI00369678A1